MTTRIITSCDDSGPGSLRDALAAAGDGDLIDLTRLTCGTITLTSGELEITVDNLTLQGPGQSALAIDGNGTSRVLRHTGAGSLLINDLAIVNGRYSASGNAFGGCIYSNSQEASLILSNSTVSGCVAGGATNTSGAVGGGIFVSGNLTMIDSTLSGNLATASPMLFNGVLGGGAFVDNGDVRLINSTISDNTASLQYGVVAFALGGGISALDSPMTTVTGTTFSANRVIGWQARSGGLEASYAVVTDSLFLDNEVVGTYDTYASAAKFGVLIMADSTVANNSTSGIYGYDEGDYALRVTAGFTISGSTISGNRAAYCAGLGFFTNYGTASTAIVDSTFSGNRSSLGGGAICMNDSAVPLYLSNSTIAFNTAGGGYGAGFSFVNTYSGASANFESTIIAGNNVDDGSGSTPADVGGFYNLITGANNLIVSSNLPLPSDTIDADPLLGPLQANGGPTLTHELLAGSPAIDAGNNEAMLPFDQRGTGFERVVGPATDIGAFEAQPLQDVIFRNSFDP